jgi:4-amino-4-deoxy-L-arabinose transferase-like glycosyltransferase
MRIADGSDPALLGVYVDKPPLWLYLLSSLFRVARVWPGGGPTYDLLVQVGRLAGVAAAMVSLALLADIAHRVYGRRVAIFALALFALSPLAVRLSPSLLTDPWLVLWVLLGITAALRHRPWLAGVALGLAYATKQQAVLFLPLIFASGLLVPPQARQRYLWRLLNGCLVVVVLVVWWDSLRWQWMPSYWDRSLATYGGVALAPVEDVLGRLGGWGEQLGYLFGAPAVSGLLLMSLPLVGWLAWRTRASLAGRLDLLLVSFATGYLALHMLGTFPPWDRYLLPLVPLLALPVARALAAVTQSPILAKTPVARLGLRHGLLLLLTLALAQSAWLGTSGGLPVGDNRAYDGVDLVANHVREAGETHQVLYHHSLGWHYGFYLHGTDVELRWWEDPDELAAKALASRDRPQYIAFPDGQDRVAAEDALRSVGLSLAWATQAFHQDGSPSLVLYRLQAEGPGAGTDGG